MTADYVRPPAVAGRFYPGDARAIEAALGELSAEAPGPAEQVLGVLLPHAGWIYSGRTAMRTLARARVPDTCVVLCPNHTGLGESFAIQSSGAWRLPVGDIPIASEVASALLASSRLLREDRRAHQGEHAIEVELPMLRSRQPELRFVPICVGSLDAGKLATLGKEMAQALAAIDPRPLIVISSDMTHYEPAVVARQKDFSAIACLERVDPEGLYQTVRAGDISMCGIAPATAALGALRAMGATAGTLVHYSHSGERTHDETEVVGYAGLTFV